jgi:hypothetical protein
VTFTNAQSILASSGVRFEPGLTDAEFLRIERQYRFQFPPDLREFLSIGLPVSSPWLDWRSEDDASIRERLALPLDGICFDISQNSFWLDEWGTKPSDMAAAFEVARRAVADAPILIPICSHRYVPAVPCEAGNPIFSVHQTDIIHYGADLMEYLQNEFSYYFGRTEFSITRIPRRIAFWSRLIELNEKPSL